MRLLIATVASAATRPRNEAEERDDGQRDDLRRQVGPPPHALRQHRSQRAGPVVDPDRRRGEDRDEDERERLNDPERGRDAARQREALICARHAGRQGRGLLAALRSEAGDDLGIEIGRLPGGIAGEEVVAGDGARRPSLLLLQRRRHGELSARGLEVPVREELAPHRELREEDREHEEDPEHPAPPELEPLPQR